MELKLNILETGPADPDAHLLLAHGAGAGMATPFMNAFADLLAARGVATTRFEFKYMAERAETGRKRPAPRAETLQDEYLAAVQTCAARHPGRPFAIGGKSMGGRVASLVADGLFASGAISGLVCLGYPFHPPAKPDQLRTAHLTALRCPTLIVQGERDPFGNAAEVAQLTLSLAITIHWLGDGDHDFGPRGAAPYTRKGNFAQAADAVAAFLASLPATR